MIRIGFFILMVLLFSCTEDPSPGNDQIDQFLVRTEWFLHLINDEEIDVISYDSTKCIDGVPYGFINREKIELIDPPPPTPSKNYQMCDF